VTNLLLVTGVFFINKHAQKFVLERIATLATCWQRLVDNFIKLSLSIELQDNMFAGHLNISIYGIMHVKLAYNI